MPPERLGDYLRGFDALLREAGLDGVPYGHFGDGCVHVRIDFPLREPGGPAGFRSFVEAAADLTAAHGGSMSGEHGDGRARSALLPRMYSPEVIALFAGVKHLFDPQRLLNPGVLVDPRPVEADLRLAARLREPRHTLRLVHDGGSVTDAVHRCTGVGKCVADNTGSGGVMCPSYLATRDEKDSTRGRSRVLQEMVNGGVVTDGWRSDEVHEALDLCLSCKGCASDCPTGIDMATYKAEALHQRYRRRLRPRSHYALGQLPRWTRLAQPAAPVLNRLMRVGPLQRAAKAAAGIDARRERPDVRPGRAAALGARPQPARRPGRGGVGGLVHRRVRLRQRPGRGRGAGGGGPARRRGHRARLLRADLDQHRPAGLRAPDPGAHRRRAPPVRRPRHPRRRAGAVVPGDAPLGRRRAQRRPARRRGGRRGALAGRDAGRRARLDAAGPDRHDGRRAAALPPRQRGRVGRRRRAARPHRRRGHPGRRLLRAGRELRGRAGPLRGVGRGRGARPAARRTSCPGRGGRPDGGARRRVLLPHAAGRPRRRARAAPRGAARRRRRGRRAAGGAPGNRLAGAP